MAEKTLHVPMLQKLNLNQLSFDEPSTFGIVAKSLSILYFLSYLLISAPLFSHHSLSFAFPLLNSPFLHVPYPSFILPPCGEHPCPMMPLLPSLPEMEAHLPRFPSRVTSLVLFLWLSQITAVPCFSVPWDRLAHTESQAFIKFCFNHSLKHLSHLLYWESLKDCLWTNLFITALSQAQHVTDTGTKD